MGACETMVVVRKGDGETVVINADAFDASLHSKPGEEKKHAHAKRKKSAKK